MRPRPLTAVLLALCVCLPLPAALANDDDTAPIERPLPTIVAPTETGEPDASSFDTEAPPPPPFDPNYRSPSSPDS